MNKNLKGAVAIGAGVILLLGGGGTLALWNADATVNAGSITSGTLDFDTTAAAGTWYHYDAALDIDDYATAGTAVNTSTYLVVPEDELIYIYSDVELSASGGELYFTVSATSGTSNATGFTIDDVLVTETSSPTSLPSPINAADGQYDAVAEDTPVYGVTTVTPVNATVALSFVVTFDANGVANQGETINFAAAEVSIQQVVKDPTYTP